MSEHNWDPNRWLNCFLRLSAVWLTNYWFPIDERSAIASSQTMKSHLNAFDIPKSLQPVFTLLYHESLPIVIVPRLFLVAIKNNWERFGEQKASITLNETHFQSSSSPRNELLKHQTSLARKQVRDVLRNSLRIKERNIDDSIDNSSSKSNLTLRHSFWRYESARLSPL